MRSEGSRFTWGSGGEAVFAQFCVCGRNRRQPSATVRKCSQPSACPPYGSPHSRACLEWSQKRVKLSYGAAVTWAFAAEVSVRLICVAAVILVSAEEVSVRVTCGAAVILVFAEELSVRVICVAAVILVFAAGVSVSAICVAAVISTFAAEVSV